MEDDARINREKEFLALLLNKNEFIDKLRVKPKYLKSTENQKMLDLIIKYYKQYKVVNGAQILRDLREAFNLNLFLELYTQTFYHQSYEHFRIYENMIIDDYKNDFIEHINQQYKDKTISFTEYMEKMQIVKEFKVNDNNTIKMKTIDDIDLNNIEEAKEFVKSGCEELDKKIGGFILGELSVWSGGNASGKSSYLNQLAIETINQGYNVAVYSGELTDKRLLNWIALQCAGADNVKENKEKNCYYVPNEIKKQIFNWLNNKLFIYDNSFGNKVEEIIESIEECVAKNNIKVVILDNLMSMNLAKYGNDKYDIQSKFVQDLSALAKKYNIHIHFVCHPRKTTTFLRKVDISGSADLTNIADNVFIMHRVNNDFRIRASELFGWNEGNPIFGFSNVIEICKNREYGVEDYFCGLLFETECKRFDNKLYERKCYSWGNLPN